MSYFIHENMFLLEDFTLEELKKAYRKLALIKHPDRQHGSAVQFLELKKHYEILCALFKK
ncbi:MAG: DnaJ domain-containing protein [Bdellovibrionaceae bacterium]|nr:DnaJ domain-containing protein [Pseudobdellovibrionaceae bacterium]